MQDQDKQPHPLDEQVEQIEVTKERAQKVAEDMLNKDPANEEMKGQLDGTLSLMTSVFDSIKQIMEDENTRKSFDSINEKLLAIKSGTSVPTEITTELTMLISTILVNSTYNAISIYDESLKNSLEKDFADIQEYLRMVDSDNRLNHMKLMDIEKHLIAHANYTPASAMGERQMELMKQVENLPAVEPNTLPNLEGNTRRYVCPTCTVTLGNEDWDGFKLEDIPKECPVCKRKFLSVIPD